MRHGVAKAKASPAVKGVTATVHDTFYAQWDVDGRWYMWMIFKLRDGTLIVNRYLA